MKYRLGSLTVEAIDTYVRVSNANFGGLDGPTRVAVTKKQYPTYTEIVQIVMELTEARGHWPCAAVLDACSRAAQDAKNNKIELDL